MSAPSPEDRPSASDNRDVPSEAESYEELLAHIDEALASGNAADETWDEIDGPWRDRLVRETSVLKRLHRIWPRSGSTSREGELSTKRDPVRAGRNAFPEGGVTLGRFVVRRELGRGGNGVVFLADDPQLDRQVALKVPHLEIVTDAALRKRFFQESRAAASLDHPHIVPIFEAGEIGPICYIASAYCDGLTLGEWLYQTTAPVPTDQVVRLMSQLAEGIAHAHERGVLHRDLKPSNVLLFYHSESAGDCEVAPEEQAADGSDASRHERSLSQLDARIADFGLARITTSNASSTQAGTVLGTPSYMAPEQAHGKVDSLTEAVDIYGLGAVMYELLVGRPPFEGDNAVEIVRQVTTADPVEIVRLRPGVPRDLATICHKCLAKDPHRRYSSARALLDDLRRFADGEPVLARPVGRMERLWRSCRRHPLESVLVAALFLVVAVAFVGVYTQWHRAEDRAREAASQRKMADRERARAEHTLRVSMQSIDSYFTTVSDELLLDRPGTEKLREQLLDSARRYYEVFLENNPDHPRLRRELAAAWLRIGMIQSQLGRISEARQALAEAHRRATAHYRRHTHDPDAVTLLASCKIRLAQNATDRGDTATAEATLRSALDLLHQLPYPDPSASPLEYRELVGDAHLRLAVVYEMGGASHDSIANAKTAIAICRQLVAEFPDQVAQRFSLSKALITLGACYASLGDIDRAIDAWEESLACFPVAPDSSAIRSTLAATHSNLGSILNRKGRADAARAHYEQGRDLIEHVLAANPDALQYLEAMAALYLNQGVFSRRLGDPEAAERHLNRAAALWERMAERGPEVPKWWHGLAKTKLSLAYVASSQRDVDKSRQLLSEAYDIWTRIGEESPDVVEYQLQRAATRSVLASSYSRERDSKTAMALYPEVIETYRSIIQRRPELIEAHSALGAVLNDVAITYRNMGEFEKAIATCREAIEHQAIAYQAAPIVRSYRRFMRNHHDTLGSVYLAAGMPRESFEAYRQVRPYVGDESLQIVRLSRSYVRVATLLEDHGPQADLRAQCIDASLNTLEDAIDCGFGAAQFLQTDSVFQTLKGNPRFQRLTERVIQQAKAASR